ncbi:glycosyltransferase family 62 protein [Suhomyces tanzawaensis NRRL Y-17324]|uniref:Glycosyltransferase family 62 protein n=1 Tax=Suhomyces tanzawaensis NRRL Y-17324 TaxID=984487 RepID=A0A1E4SS91_9ASCO|nr:glycosyltransferase family 62 protein [Suhomyces tanzawaensis NRRL Y-17324]ODV82374.1 glycosyltransferase family 62 protein [Suhomyces tanzawaensis NRRL Y-17324]
MVHSIQMTPYEYDSKAGLRSEAGSKAAGKWSLSKAKIASFWMLLLVIFGLTRINVKDTFSALYSPDFSGVPRVQYFDLEQYSGHANGWQHDERVLFCVPLRDAAAHLPMFFGHMKNLTYPHNLIDLAFLVSDSSDDTMGVLKKHLNEVQSDPNPAKRFGEIEIFEKDFGQVIGQGFSDRHGFAAQGPRRKLMARARNWLWTVAIKPYHSFVYWRDADVETVPPTILEDLMHHDKDVIVPNVWRPLPDWLGNQQPYDLNSWQESDGGLQLAETLGEDACIVEGYVEYQTWRPHLAYLRDPYGDPEVEMDLDGIGGVSILTKAKVFRTGSHFPAFSFEKHAETEAFGKLSKRMGYSVIGLPHYVIWHIYEPSSDDLKHMEWMALEESRQKEEAKIKKVYDKVWNKAFDDVQEDWGKERAKFLKNTDMSKLRQINVDWSGADDWAIDETKQDSKKLADFNP